MGSGKPPGDDGAGHADRGGKLTKVSLGLHLGVHLRVGGALARGDSLGPGLLHRLGATLVEDVGHEHRAWEGDGREHHAHRREGDEEGPRQEDSRGRLPGAHDGEVVGIVPGVTGDRRRHRASSPARMSRVPPAWIGKTPLLRSQWRWAKRSRPPQSPSVGPKRRSGRTTREYRRRLLNSRRSGYYRRRVETRSTAGVMAQVTSQSGASNEPWRFRAPDRFSAADSQEWRDMDDPRRRLYAGQSGKNRKS